MRTEAEVRDRHMQAVMGQFAGEMAATNPAVSPEARAAALKRAWQREAEIALLRWMLAEEAPDDPA